MIYAGVDIADHIDALTRLELYLTRVWIILEKNMFAFGMFDSRNNNNLHIFCTTLSGLSRGKWLHPTCIITFLTLTLLNSSENKRYWSCMFLFFPPFVAWFSYSSVFFVIFSATIRFIILTPKIMVSIILSCSAECSLLSPCKGLPFGPTVNHD